ncbi:hypothetical protein OB905_05320 [Halobacteria archaeon AArc-dxtr1]|nr:hypothetical protein [Halobacteria archaeon AArc-dxtr1]
MNDDSPTPNESNGRKRPLERRSARDDEPDEWLVVPASATEHERQTNWIAADESTFVDLGSAR